MATPFSFRNVGEFVDARRATFLSNFNGGVVGPAVLDFTKTATLCATGLPLLVVTGEDPYRNVLALREEERSKSLCSKGIPRREMASRGLQFEFVERKRYLNEVDGRRKRSSALLK